MRRPGRRFWLIGPGIFVVLVVAPLERPAQAAEGPLLVVIEAPPALDADAAEIRRVIGTELHTRTIAPMSTPAEAPGRALIVALDRDRIAMSLRASDGASVARIIPAPVERAARLRAIAWLAGNLARDQVSPILAEAPAESSALATMPALPAPSAPAEPPPAATEPQPTAPTPSIDSPPARTGDTTISLRTQPPEAPRALRWSISASIGPVIGDFLSGTTFSFQNVFEHVEPSTGWQISVQRGREHERLVIGGRLEGTYNHSGNGQGPQLIGADVFVGASWRHKYCNLEATIGAGPEAASVIRFDFQPYPTPGGSNTTTSITPYFVYALDLYTQGTAIAAIPLGGTIEGLLGVGAHLNAFQDRNWFATATIGLRYKLQ